MNIFSCIDNKNIDKIFVLFYSCFLNCSKKENLKFYILVEQPYQGSIPFIFRNNLIIRNIDKEFLINSNWIDIIEQFSNNFYIQGAKCNNIMNFSRFFFFQTFPEVDRAIYLDWDMIVEGDIYKLINEYNTDKLIVASSLKTSFDTICGNIANLNPTEFNIVSCKNYYNPLIFKLNTNQIRKNIFKKYNELIFNITGHENAASKKSFNAGFYIVSKNIFNLDNIKQLIEKLLIEQKKEKVFRFGTQVIMNLLSINNIIFVDKRWNNIPNQENYITHWNGTKIPKPWDSKDPLWIKYFNLFQNSAKEMA